MPNTARFALPLLAVAQAQKEVTHNEALTRIDALVHAAIEAGPQSDPPPTPAEGQCWLVGVAATGAWVGQANALAVWSGGGWRFIAPRAGLRTLRLTDGAWLRFDGTAWVEPPTVATPGGGSTVDSEARTALGALILVLRGQGLLF